MSVSLLFPNHRPRHFMTSRIPLPSRKNMNRISSSWRASVIIRNLVALKTNGTMQVAPDRALRWSGLPKGIEDVQKKRFSIFTDQSCIGGQASSATHRWDCSGLVLLLQSEQTLSGRGANQSWASDGPEHFCTQASKARG
jgi:hypothetical protein